MKRTLTLTLIALLSLSHLPTAIAQDESEKTRSITNRPPDKMEDEDDATEVAVQKKKVPHKPVRFGMEIGLSSCYMWRPSATNDPVFGARVGGFLYVPLVGKLYLQPGLYYVTNGGSQTEGMGSIYPATITTTYNVNAIELPVNLGFRFGHKRNRYISFIGLGGYVARNLGGRVAFDDGITKSESLVIGSNDGQNFKAFDYGLALNASIEWRCGLFMRGLFQYGLANLAPHLATMNSITEGFQFGYLFGKKPKQYKKHFSRMTRDNDRYNDPTLRIRDE